jgi:hypothetical protein
MRAMERSTASQPPPADPLRPPAGVDTDERDRPQIRSLITPGLMSVPPMPAWLRKLLRRTDTHASR